MEESKTSGCETAKEKNVKLINMADVEATDTKWLWPNYIPYGKITLLLGDPGEGKTTLSLHLAAKLSLGMDFISDEIVREAVVTIYQTAEDGLSDTIKPRLLAMGADCSKISVIDECDQPLDLLDERLEFAIQASGAKVVIIDPIQCYMGPKIDMNKANEVRQILKNIAALAEKYHCAMILVGHLNKSIGNKTLYRGLGSIDFIAAARSVLIVGKLKDSQNIRALVHEKSSLAPIQKALSFEFLEGSVVNWLGEINITSEDLLGGTHRVKKSDTAEKLLRENLKNGALPANELYAKAADQCISKRLVDQVKKDLGIVSYKTGEGWFWKLSDHT